MGFADEEHPTAILEQATYTGDETLGAVDRDTTVDLMWQTLDAPSLRHALDIERRTQIMCTATGDTTEARAAFVE